MTTIHQTSHGYARAKGFDEHLENIVVTNLAGTLEIDGDQRFVVPILFVAILISDAAAVTYTFSTDSSNRIVSVRIELVRR